MLPQGGERVWGSIGGAPDDTEVTKGTDYTFGAFMCLPHEEASGSRSCRPLSVTDSIDLMFNSSGDQTRAMWGAGESIDPLERIPPILLLLLLSTISLVD